MKIKIIENKQEWENFLKPIKEKTFLHSWNWGRFNEMMNFKIWRFGIFDNKELKGVFLTIKIKAKRGTLLFIPHGPLIKEGFSKKEALILVLKELKVLAKEEKAFFIRVAPLWEDKPENRKIFLDLGFRLAPIHIHPEITWELNLLPKEEELLMAMRKTTRYLIRQGLKNKNLKIEKTTDGGRIKEFISLYKKTAQRQAFVPFSSVYLKNEFLAFAPDNQILIFLAYYQDKPLAGAMIVFWQKRAFYHQGASVPTKIPASYLLQWEAIREAKTRGCEIYNFWGIAPENKKTHPWQGLSFFKKGFGGYKKQYLPTFDYILSPLYWFNFIIEKIRKKKRGL